MHAKAPYEEIIAGKLAALSRPDMADAIWARIEHQLDIDLPADDGDALEPPPNAGDGLPVLVGSSILLFIGALVTYFYFQLGARQNAILPNNSIPSKVQNKILLIKASSEKVKNPAPDKAFYPPRVKHAKEMAPTQKTSLASREDTAAIMPVPGSGTAITLPTTTPPLAEVKKDSSVRKRRGVQGIQTSDYSIVPKNDST